MYLKDASYSYWQYTRKNSAENKPQSIDVMILGDSRAQAAINPLQFHQAEVFNYALGGATPVVGYYTLKHFLEKNRSPKKILLSYSVSVLSTSGERIVYRKRMLPYFYISFSEHRQVYRYMLNENSLFYDVRSFSYYIKQINPFVYMKNISLDKLRHNKATNNSVKDYVGQHRGHLLFGQNLSSAALNFEAKNKKPIEISKVNWIYLEKLVRLANENNTKIYWYSMPFIQASCDVIKSKNLQQGLTEKLKDYGVITLTTEQCLPNNYFGDANHVNKQGAFYVTKDVIEKLQLN